MFYFKDTLYFLSCRFPSTCLPAAPTGVGTAAVSNQPQQRLISWTASPGIDSLTPTSYNVTCTTGTFADMRTSTVTSPTTSVTLGTGTGYNAPLTAKGTYTCSVTATNAAGQGAAGSATAFSVTWCTALGSVSSIPTATEIIASPYTLGLFQDDTRSSATTTVVNAPIQLSGATIPSFKMGVTTNATTSLMKASAYFNYQYGTDCSAVCGGSPYTTESSAYCGSQSPLGALSDLTKMVFTYYRATGGTAINTASPTVRLRVSNLASPTQTTASWADLGKLYSNYSYLLCSALKLKFQ